MDPVILNIVHIVPTYHFFSVTTPFCDTVGAEMDDSMTFSVYLEQLNDGNGTDDKKVDDDEKVEDDNENAQNESNSKSKKKVS